jgi:hypothetical protein
MTRAVSLWEQDAPLAAREVAPVEVDLDRPATEEHRWRGQTVTAPIEQMVRAGAHAGENEARFADRYDLRRLAHRAIDAVVASMGFARELTDTELIAGIAATAATMAPEAGQAEWQAVAEFLYAHLMNAPDDFAKFSYTGIDAEGRRRPFEFQLLVPREAESGIAINASPEAINVFLKAFDLDVTDAEVAVSVMLERQINDGRFEAAARTAEAAGRISVAAAARIGELLEDTKRDLGSVDWRGSMREELERARRHVSSRITEDDRLHDHVQSGTDSDDRAVREASGEIAELLLTCKRLHLRLEDRLVRAHRTFLDAQTEQRLARRARLRLLSLKDQVFEPTLRLPAAGAARVTDAFAAEALGPVAPRVPWLAGLIDALLAPSRIPEPAPREAEEPDLADEPELQTYSDAANAAARAVFASAAAAPRRLADLLADARASVDPEVLDLVWLGSLWAFAPDAPDDLDVELASIVGELTADLAAEDDGTALADRDFAGADLLVGRPDALAALLAPPATAEAPGPISLDAYRSAR